MKKIAITTWEGIWYVLMNIGFGAGYMAKVPVKKALFDYGLIHELTAAERFWYVIENIAMGAGYFNKVIASKALSELPHNAEARRQSVTRF